MNLVILTYQTSCGACFWVYANEIATEVSLGIFLMVLMTTSTLTTSVVPFLIGGSFGVANTFFAIAGLQIITVSVVVVYLKETRGLTLK